MNNTSQHNSLASLAERPVDRSRLIRRWYDLTSLPDASSDSTFAQRETVRRSRLTSSVIFFLAALILSLLPVTFLVISIYPTYFWLSLGLFFVCLIGLALNRRGLINTAGFVVTTGSFLSLAAAFFTTHPFDETTLQGYDMFVLTLLLAVSLLPPRMVFFFFVLCVGVIVGSLLTMPYIGDPTPVLKADIQSRLILILARPVGTLFMAGGVAYILAIHLTRAIGRAYHAETVARLEHEQAELRKNLESGINQILQTHVQVSNGNLSARAPLSDDNVLWQIARALNTLLVRYQRATRAEQELGRVEQAVRKVVQAVQQAEMQKQKIRLPLTQTAIDPLIAALQGQPIASSPVAERTPTSSIPRDEETRLPYHPKQW